MKSMAAQQKKDPGFWSWEAQWSIQSPPEILQPLLCRGPSEYKHYWWSLLNEWFPSMIGWHKRYWFNLTDCVQDHGSRLGPRMLSSSYEPGLLLRSVSHPLSPSPQTSWSWPCPWRWWRPPAASSSAAIWADAAARRAASTPASARTAPRWCTAVTWRTSAPRPCTAAAGSPRRSAAPPRPAYPTPYPLTPTSYPYPNHRAQAAWPDACVWLRPNDNNWWASLGQPIVLLGPPGTNGAIKRETWKLC